jgi:carbonic anhydrase
MKALLIPALLSLLAAPAAAQEQSPIDLRSSDAILATLPPLLFNYGSNVSLTLLNNGAPDPEKTVRATPTGTNSLSVDGITYNLQQFHFHINCEHLLNGQVFPMEAHFVHQSDSGVYTVVGRFIEIGAENLLLKPIFDNLPQIANGTFNIASFDLSALVPTDLRSYRYDGSLTTPGFTEGVNWVVLHDRLVMSQAQVDSFGALFPNGNFREVQERNGRTILTDVASFVPEPASWAMLIVGFGTVGGLLRRRRAIAMA